MSRAVDPDATVAAFQRATGSNDWPAAVAALDALLTLAPNDAGLYYNRALALRLAGRPRDGLAAAERAIALMPDHPKAMFERGACALEAGDARTALEASEAHLAADAEDADAALNAARAALLLGKPDRALTHLGPLKGEAATLARGEALRDLGRFEEAEAAWSALPPSTAPAILSLRTKGARGRLSLHPRA